MNVHRFLRSAFFAVFLLGLAGLSFAQFGVSISSGVAPPPLPVYDQPPLPEAGYVWTPGYWSWGDDGYYWVPGTWVQPPEAGLLWTPGYWGWNDDDQAYDWYDGYWANDVGYYGGIDYGYGYPGDGYYGGRWQGNNFYYNNAVNSVQTVRITNVYTQQVPQRSSVEHVSYNGGQGGVQARPTPQQSQSRSQHHVEATAAQRQQVQAAKSNPQLFARNNQGKPAVAATSRPGDMSHPVAAKAAGGRVDPKALSADAKNTPKPAARNGNNRTNANSAATAPKPPNANERGSQTRPAESGTARSTEPGAARPAQPSANATRPSEPKAEPAKPESERSTSNASGTPQSEGTQPRGTEPAHRAAEPPSATRSEGAAGHPAGESRSAPEKRPAAPAEHSNEKQHPDNEHDKPQ